MALGGIFWGGGCVVEYLRMVFKRNIICYAGQYWGIGGRGHFV